MIVCSFGDGRVQVSGTRFRSCYVYIDCKCKQGASVPSNN